MEFFLLYLFICIEKFSTALAVGWIIFWIPAAMLGLVIIFSLINGIMRYLSLSRRFVNG